MYASNKPKKSRRHGDWSDWIWSPDYERYYRQRQKADGSFDTEWAEPAQTDETTPRETAEEELTAGIAGLGLETPGAATAYDVHTAEYTVSGSSRSKSKATTKSTGRSKGKGRSYAEEDEAAAAAAAAVAAGGRADATHSSDRHAGGNAGEQYYDPATGQYYSYPDQQTAGGTASSYSTDSGYSSTTRSRSGQYSQNIPPEDEEDAAYQAALAASRDYAYGSAGESASSAYATGYDYEDEGPPTPKASSSTHISATEGAIEELDPRYRVEHSNRFQPGEIFKVLWSEPQGINDGAPSVSDRREFRDRFGGKFFVGFRRFIVIANDLGHCTCVPILTYGGKGCKKKGVKPEKHGIIHEKGHKVKLLDKEPKLGFPPVRVEITEDGEKLSKESRVNYSKLVTVEHNVKVFFIGRITLSDGQIVSDAVNRCWEEKIHHKKRFR